MHSHALAIAETCAKYGIKQVVICPGSRSAPLVLAFTRHKDFSIFSVPDERSAAHMALGMAQQTGIPVVIITTSGTAALNAYPALAEAFFQRIPLILLTADRPARLLFQQEGQMIRQYRALAANVVQSYQIEQLANPVQTYNTAARSMIEALHAATGSTKGPVHVNIPFEEPLYDSRYKKGGTLPDIAFPKSTLPPIPKSLLTQWKRSSRRLILAGQLPVDSPLFTALYALTRDSGTVLLSDVASNQHALATVRSADFITGHLNQNQLDALAPDLIISFGGPHVSKSLGTWMKGLKKVPHYRIDPGRHEIDTWNHHAIQIKAKPSEWLKQLPELKSNSTYKDQWKKAEIRAQQSIRKFISQTSFSELHATDVLLRNLPDAINLQLANSSCVRYVSWLGELNPSWRINSNRGTSGIDGCSSTAVGAALVNNQMTVLLTGDLAFLYDRNAFWHQHIPDNLRIVVINNQGGGIFTLIDGPTSFPKQLNYFTTPHQQDLSQVARSMGLSFRSCNNKASMQRELRSFLQPDQGPGILEVRIDMQSNARIFKQFKSIRINTYGK